MGENLSKILIRTVLSRGIRDMQDDPNRTSRKLVDMAANFAAGPFQRRFFQKAQQLLEDESSGYYQLAENLMRHTEEDRLITFGMNIGYNACTLGAAKIRRVATKEKCNIPWSISLEIIEDHFEENKSWYETMIRQGEDLGIYCWILVPDRNPETVLDLVREHPDSAFAIVCPKETDIPNLIEQSEDCKNSMLTISYDQFADEACEMLKQAGMLYSLYYRYHRDAVADIENGSLFAQMECLDPAFCALIPEKDCPEHVQKQVHRVVQEERLSQKYHTVLWEFVRDTMLVDGVISENGCWAGFDGYRNFYELRNDRLCHVEGRPELELIQILRLAEAEINRDYRVLEEEELAAAKQNE